MSTAFEIFIVPAIWIGILVTGILVIAWRVARPGVLARRAALEQSGGWQASYRQLRAANDAVIDQFEAHPSLSAEFPADVRDLVYRAHEDAMTVERNR